MTGSKVRHTRKNPCPVCGGYDGQERGAGIRCCGWTSDGWCNCSREEHAGTLARNENSSTYAHRLSAPCLCGGDHGGGFTAVPHARSTTSGKSVTSVTSVHANKKQAQVAALYDYTDADGNPLYQVVRYEPKAFKQRRRGPSNEWVWNLSGVDRVLYRLPYLLKASPDTTVFITEGEKDADRLAQHGLCATTCSQGAGKWRPEYNEALRGHPVVVLADNDEKGRNHAQVIAASLCGIADSVTVVAFEELPEHGDVSDWLSQSGDDIGALLERVHATPEWEAPEPPQPSAPQAGGDNGDTGSGDDDPRLPAMPHPTDLGSSRVFHDRFAHDRARFVGEWGWMCWEGARWVRDRTGEAWRLSFLVWEAWDQAARVAATLAAEAEAAKDKDGEARYGGLAAAWRQAAANYQSHSGIRNLLSLAENHAGLRLPVEAFDRNDLLFNLLSGTLDVRTGQMRPHAQEDAITKLARTRYDPRATAPRWQAFLERVLPDPDVRHYLQRAVGYTLTGLTHEQCFFILHGPGANGKSVFCNLLAWLWGDYAVFTRPETFMARDRDNIPTDVAALNGARLVITTEPPEAMRLNTSLVKQLTGGDMVSARILYHDFFSFEPKFKLFIATNHLPKIPESTHAMWRRVALIAFGVTIPAAEQDKQLPEKLKEEAAGILNWAIEGYHDWAAQGLNPPSRVAAATSSYRAEEDVVAAFLDECCTVRKDLTCPKARLYACYQAWAAENGERPWSHKRFAQRMAEQAGIESEHDRKDGKVWVGVSVGQAFS